MDDRHEMTGGVSEEIDKIAASSLQKGEGQMDLKKISRRAAAVAEKSMIVKTLRKTKWNRWKAAKELKVSHKTLLTKTSSIKLGLPVKPA